MSFSKEVKDFARSNWNKILITAMVVGASFSASAQNNNDKQERVKALVENLKNEALKSKDMERYQTVDSIAKNDFNFFVEVYDKMKAKEFFAYMKKEAIAKKDTATLKNIVKLESNDAAMVKMYNSLQEKSGTTSSEFSNGNYKKKVVTTKTEDGISTKTSVSGTFSVADLSKEEFADYNMIITANKFKNKVNDDMDFSAAINMKARVAMVEIKADPSSKDNVIARETRGVDIDKDNGIMYYKDRAYLNFTHDKSLGSAVIVDKDSKDVKSYLKKKKSNSTSKQNYKESSKTR